MQHAMAQGARGGLPANIALMQMIVAADSPDDIDAVLHGREGDPLRLAEMRQLWQDNPQAWNVIRSVLAEVGEPGAAATPAEEIALWRGVFDRVAAISGEGSVALYSLGNPAILRAATAEIVGRLDEWGLLGPTGDVLDFGCGNGRIEEALSAKVASIVGVDVSGSMVKAAGIRCRGLGNVRFEQSTGEDLRPFADASFDLVLAVDSFPYLVQPGLLLAQTMMREAARILRPGGSFVILNFSYRGDGETDLRDARLLAETAGFRLRREGTRDFSLWDGRAFHFLKL
ncbi:Methyltransferase domain-containing protein [Faunimonas pinastri]|uniref:Methyltransferase domain-containing protein n=2 Tax=Faunimonas pinastri TaxID=1855383 RepID=A0A1H9FJF8_9HYPH|nr:Methyltransferase domain-containing protein [Faunimonas pinastri]